MSDSVITVPIEYPSHDGKTTISAKIWTSPALEGTGPDGAERPKGVIQIVHGMAEYVDRYDDFARFFVDRGFVVCGEDHIGHGHSASSPDEFGHMPVRGGRKILVEDVHMLRQIVSGIYEEVPYVLYGHSMGSFIARAYVTRHGEGLAGCVLSGTGNMPAAVSVAGRTLARTLAKMRGETHRSALIDGMGAGAYGKRIEGARTPLDWLSRDKRVVDAYIADDMCGFMFTVGGYATLLDLTAKIVTPKYVASMPKGLPVLFVAGDGDPVGDMGKGVEAAAALLKKAGVKHVDTKLYPGMRHEIHNEFGREQVLDDIASWVEAHV